MIYTSCSSWSVNFVDYIQPTNVVDTTHADAGGSSAGSMQAEQQQHSTATERASKASGKQVPAAKSLKRPQGTVATADGPAAGTATAAGPADTSDAGAAALAPAPPKTVKKPVTKTAADSSTEEAAAPGNEPTPPKHDAEEASVTAAMPKAAVKPKQPAVKTAAAKAAAKTAAAAAAADVVGMEQQEAHPAAAEESTGTDGAPPAAIAPAVAKPAAKKAASKAPSPAEQVADLAAGEAGNTEPAAPAAQASAAAKPAVVKKKPAKVSITGDAASISANSPAAAPSTHGSNPSRKGLHTLFGEGSTVSVLSQEGSEMPGELDTAVKPCAACSMFLVLCCNHQVTPACSSRSAAWPRVYCTLYHSPPTQVLVLLTSCLMQAVAPQLSFMPLLMVMIMGRLQGHRWMMRSRRKYKRSSVRYMAMVSNTCWMVDNASRIEPLKSVIVICWTCLTEQHVTQH